MNIKGYGFWASGLILPVLGGVAACSGDEFCEESRTCAGIPAGSSGAAGGEDGGSSSVDPVGSSPGGESSVSSEGGRGGQGEPIGSPCSDDVECDDGDSCTGTEACEGGICQAGEAVECGPGMECSADQDNACVFSTAAPWIIYVSDDETTGVPEAFGVKADLLGVMAPVKVSPMLEAGWRVATLPAWSPDGSSFVLVTANQAGTQTKAYVVKLADGLPAEPLEVTEGMSASKATAVSWSKTGGTLTLLRDNGLHVVDLAADGGSSHARVSADGYDQITAWIKSDDELVYVARNTLSAKWAITLVERAGGSWTRDPLISDLALVTAGVSPDRSFVGYYVDNGSNLVSLWTIETAKGSSPLKIAGPVSSAAIYPAPDASHYLLATTTVQPQLESEVFGGATSTLSAPPSLKANVHLVASEILGGTFEGPWSPDSSRAAIFQGGTFGRQLVLYEPGAAEPWQVCPQHQVSRNDGEPFWAPNSEMVGLATRTAAGADLTLTLVGSPTSKLDVDTVPSAGSFRMAGFSVGGEYAAYYKSTDKVTQDGGYVDLRQGLANAGSGVPLPGVGAVGRIELATTTLEVAYTRGARCYYLDLSGSDAAEPVQVNGNGDIRLCSFQRLPR